jgi:hypothetical protein
MVVRRSPTFPERARPRYGLWPLRTGLDRSTKRTGDLPVLVHIVSQRARVLRLRRIEAATRVNATVVLPTPYSE